MIPADLIERCVRIKARLVQFRYEGWERFRKVHGVSTHQLELERPLPEDALVAFERLYGIDLVPEHRAFLAHVGNGGAGPNHGIERLKEAFKGPAIEEYNELAYLRTPFPHAFGAVLSEGWMNRSSDDRDFALVGTMTVCETGCGGYIQLVTAGPARGRLLAMHVEDYAATWIPAASFLDWYEAWMDELSERRA